MTEKTELDNLVDKMVLKFSKQVGNEKDLAVVLLKGHLLIEYYLNHIILYWYDQAARVDNKSFFEKIRLVEVKGIFKNNLITCLYSLNKVRNDLSHKLDFSISESEIDRVGFHLGKNYIIEKFKNNQENDLQRLLIWVLVVLLSKVCVPLFVQMQNETSVPASKNNDKKI